MTDRTDGVRSPSGVFIAHDFRSNLIIDRYDPVFADMRASKCKHLRSANSEDAVTWNVFRSLRQVAPEDWLPTAWRFAFPDDFVPADQLATVKLWESISPPLGLLAEGDEGASEIDVIIESSSWVWFIEAKYRSDISTRTTKRPQRDQVLRNIDVGTYYAGVRPFYFSLLVHSEEVSREGAARIRQYKDREAISPLLGHRRDGLRNLAGTSLLTWRDMGDVLRHAASNARREDERAYAAQALSWLRTKGMCD